jgi:hypothetical protein
MLNALPIDFASHQALRNDARDLAPGPEAGIGDDAHQADITSAIDEFNVLMG